MLRSSSGSDLESKNNDPVDCDLEEKAADKDDFLTEICEHSIGTVITGAKRLLKDYDESCPEQYRKRRSAFKKISKSLDVITFQSKTGKFVSSSQLYEDKEDKNEVFVPDYIAQRYSFERFCQLYNSATYHSSRDKTPPQGYDPEFKKEVGYYSSHASSIVPLMIRVPYTFWDTVKAINEQIKRRNDFFKKFQDTEFLLKVLHDDRSFEKLRPEDFEYIFRFCVDEKKPETFGNYKLFLKKLLDNNRLGENWKPFQINGVEFTAENIQIMLGRGNQANRQQELLETIGIDEKFMLDVPQPIVAVANEDVEDEEKPNSPKSPSSEASSSHDHVYRATEEKNDSLEELSIEELSRIIIDDSADSFQREKAKEKFAQKMKTMSFIIMAQIRLVEGDIDDEKKYDIQAVKRVVAHLKENPDDLESEDQEKAELLALLKQLVPDDKSNSGKDGSVLSAFLIVNAKDIKNTFECERDDLPDLKALFEKYKIFFKSYEAISHEFEEYAGTQTPEFEKFRQLFLVNPEELLYKKMPTVNREQLLIEYLQAEFTPFIDNFIMQRRYHLDSDTDLNHFIPRLRLMIYQTFNVTDLNIKGPLFTREQIVQIDKAVVEHYARFKKDNFPAEYAFKPLSEFHIRMPCRLEAKAEIPDTFANPPITFKLLLQFAINWKKVCETKKIPEPSALVQLINAVNSVPVADEKQVKIEDDALLSVEWCDTHIKYIVNSFAEYQEQKRDALPLPSAKDFVSALAKCSGRTYQSQNPNSNNCIKVSDLVEVLDTYLNTRTVSERYEKVIIEKFNSDNNQIKSKNKKQLGEYMHHSGLFGKSDEMKKIKIVVDVILERHHRHLDANLNSDDIALLENVLSPNNRTHIKPNTGTHRAYAVLDLYVQTAKTNLDVAAEPNQEVNLHILRQEGP